MNRTARIVILAISVVVFCYAGLGHVLGQTHEERAYKSLTVYGEVLQKVQQDYVDEPNMHLVTAGALHGLLESLDPESSYLTPREYTEYKQKLASTNPGDTGLTLSKRYGYVIVISVLPESPAEKAGIHSGDIFESVAGLGRPRGRSESAVTGCGKARRAQSDFGFAELRTRTGFGRTGGCAAVYFEWKSGNAARPDSFRSNIYSGTQQSDLERTRVHFDRWNDLRSGGSAGVRDGDCAPGRRGWRTDVWAGFGAETDHHSRWFGFDTDSGELLQRGWKINSGRRRDPGGSGAAGSGSGG